MSVARPKTAILLLSHVLNKEIIALFDELNKECGQRNKVVFLGDNSRGSFNNISNSSDYYLFTIEDLNSIGYPGTRSVAYAEESRRDNPNHKDFNFIPGTTFLPPTHFYLNNPDFDYYWIIEYDVRFSGAWSSFFDHFRDNDADLLATTLTRYEAIPNWFHWPSMKLKDTGIGASEYIRGFFPIYRLSRRAFAQLDRDYRSGNSGHYEALFPTLLFKAGMRLEDIGGDGEFVRPGNVNRFYRNTPANGTLSPGTFVFRPARHRAGTEPGLLWHPVKPVPLWRRMATTVAEWTARIARRLNIRSAAER